jgi:hypothetical protein
LLRGINVFVFSWNRSEHCGLLPRAGPQRAGSDFADHIVFALKNASLVTIGNAASEPAISSASIVFRHRNPGFLMSIE